MALVEGDQMREDKAQECFHKQTNMILTLFMSSLLFLTLVYNIMQWGWNQLDGVQYASRTSLYQ